MAMFKAYVSVKIKQKFILFLLKCGNIFLESYDKNIFLVSGNSGNYFINKEISFEFCEQYVYANLWRKKTEQHLTYLIFSCFRSRI